MVKLCVCVCVCLCVCVWPVHSDSFMLNYSISSLLSPQFPRGPTIFSGPASFHPSLLLLSLSRSKCYDVKCQWTRTYRKYPTQSKHLSSPHSLLYLSGFLTLRNSAPPFTAAPLPFSHLASFSCHSSDSSLHILPPPLPTLSPPLLPPYPIHHFTARV